MHLLSYLVGDCFLLIHKIVTVIARDRDVGSPTCRMFYVCKQSIKNVVFSMFHACKVTDSSKNQTNKYRSTCFK